MYTPGESMAERAALDDVMQTAADTQIAALRREVIAATTSTVLTASGLTSFTQAAIRVRWGESVRSVLRPALIRLGLHPRRGALTEAQLAALIVAHPYLGPVTSRLRDTPLPETMYASTVETLARAANEQWTRDQTRRELSAVLSEDTASTRRTVRTEATTLHNFSVLEALARGGYTEKMWVSHHDQRTRYDHGRADGQTQPLIYPFAVGNESLMVPGDPAGSPAQTYNCRCVVAGVDQ